MPVYMICKSHEILGIAFELAVDIRRALAKSVACALKRVLGVPGVESPFAIRLQMCGVPVLSRPVIVSAEPVGQ